MELPIRKPLRLKSYDYGQNGGYFITVCTKDKAEILCQIVGGDALIAPQVRLTDCRKVVDRYIQSIPGLEKYCIMPNHVHLLILLDGPMRASAPTTVPKLISSFKGLSSKAAGFAIWQRSYYDHIIRNSNDYLFHWQYIEDNPAKWKTDDYYINLR